MPEGIRGLEEIPFVSTIAQPIQTRRRALPVHSGFTSSGQRSPSNRGGRKTTTHLFCKWGISGRRREVPLDGKISLRTGNESIEAQVVLLSSYHYSFE